MSESTPSYGDLPQPPRMSVAEFRRLGLLQEVNRMFLHPRGLALEAIVDDDGSERFGELWDYRDDPEGMGFVDELVRSPGFAVNAHVVREMMESKRAARERLYGSVIQPVPGQLNGLPAELAPIFSARQSFSLGAVVTNCVAHAGLRFDVRPRDCHLCRVDLVNAIDRAARINFFLNDLMDQVEKAVQS
jgi:hypothetical protein